MTRIELGFNCNCFTNRFDEPEEWTRLCHELGVRKVMFSIDLVDPYWPWDLQRRLCDRTLEACAKNDVAILSSFGGHNGHQHYLGHPDPQCRREAERFFRRAIRQTAYLGGRSFGTCFAIQSARTHQDPTLREQITESAVGAYSRLAVYAAELGLSSLSYEMTSVRRETCATFEENDRVLGKGMEMALPLRLCLDMGHRNLDGTPEEADHLAWILRGQITIRETWSFEFAAFPHHPWIASATAVAEGKIKASPLVTHKIPLDEVPAAIEMMASGKEFYHKVVVVS